MILQLVTDRRRLTGGGSSDAAAVRACLLEQARLAIAAGIDLLQVRERDLEAAALAAIVADLVALARGSATRVIVNDRLDVALACGAAGVHLRADSIAPAEVRRAAAPPFLIGASVHGMAAARAAAPSVDYLVAGTVWPTASKPDGHAPLGLSAFAAIAAAVRVPVLAIGGVTVERLPALAGAGAAGAAAIGLFMAPERAGCRAAPLDEVVRRARAAFDTPRSPS